MKLNFFSVHSLLLTGTVAAIAISYPLVAQASTVHRFLPPNNIIAQQPDSLIKKVRTIYAQTTENPPRDESTGGSR